MLQVHLKHLAWANLAGFPFIFVFSVAAHAPGLSQASGRAGPTTLSQGAFGMLVDDGSSSGDIPTVNVDLTNKFVKIAELPHLSVELRLGYAPAAGLDNLHDDSDPLVRIRSLHRVLKDTGNDDAGLEYDIGQLFESVGDRSHAQSAYSQAVTWYREQVAAQPRDGLLLAHLAEALDATGQFAAARSTAQQATAVSGRRWQTWATLGSVLEDQARYTLLGQRDLLFGVQNQAGFWDVLSRLRREMPAETTIDTVVMLSNQAKSCFDKAVALAPNDPQPYLLRGAFRTDYEVRVRSILSGLHGDVPNPLGGLYTPGAVADIRKAARLRPDDIALQASIPQLVAISAVVRNGLGGTLSTGRIWQGLHDADKREVAVEIERLRAKAEHQTKSNAAFILEAVGVLEYMTLNDLQSAEMAARQAISLDKSRELAWEILRVVLVEKRRYQDLITLTEAHQDFSDCGRDHLILAKSYDLLGLKSKSEAQIKSGLSQWSDDFDLRLAQVTLDIKNYPGVTKLNAIVRDLDAALLVFPSKPTNDQLYDYMISEAIVTALSGRLKEARSRFEAVLDIDGSNAQAQSAISVLDETISSPVENSGSNYESAATHRSVLVRLTTKTVSGGPLKSLHAWFSNM